MAQVSWSNMLAQASCPSAPRPPAPRTSVICTSGDTVPSPLTCPSRCHLRPPSVLVANLASTEPVLPPTTVEAAQSCPAAFTVANTGPAPVRATVQRTPPSWLTSSCPGHRVRAWSARQASEVATPKPAEPNCTRFTAAGSVASTRHRVPPSLVPSSSLPQDERHDTSTHACALSVAVTQTGLPCPCHWRCPAAGDRPADLCPGRGDPGDGPWQGDGSGGSGTASHTAGHRGACHQDTGQQDPKLPPGGLPLSPVSDVSLADKDADDDLPVGVCQDELK